MSLLRYARLRPALHAARRPAGIAFNSSQSSPPGSSGSKPPADDDAVTNAFFDTLSVSVPPEERTPEELARTQASQPAVNPADDLPPTAPPTAYPPPNPAMERNPMRVGPHPPTQPRETLVPNPIYFMHIRASKRNTIATFTRPNGNVVSTYTGGSVGFKKGNRSGYEAGFQCAMKSFESVRKFAEVTGGKMAVHLSLSGFGNGREAIFRALMAQEGDDVRKFITKVTDKTPIKIGGTRAMKARRL